MDAHTVTVQFDEDELSLEEIIHALGDAGYSVPSHAKIPQRNRRGVTWTTRLEPTAVIAFGSPGRYPAAGHIARNTLGDPVSLWLQRESARLA